MLGQVVDTPFRPQSTLNNLGGFLFPFIKLIALIFSELSN